MAAQGRDLVLQPTGLSRGNSHPPCVAASCPQAGSLPTGNSWARKNCLVPVKALSKLFRGIFLDMATKAIPGLVVPSSVLKRAWVAYCRPSIQGPDNVLTYLGRCVHRVAITNGRILAIDDGKITFRYRNCRDSQLRAMALSAKEFMRRSLQHVLPKGVHKVSYCGFWVSSNRHATGPNLPCARVNLPRQPTKASSRPKPCP